MTPYRTAAGYGEAEYEDKRSRFIGHIKPVTSENEAKAFIDEMRRTYADATHNVFAYVLREGNILRWSDDGEPGGTSGQPTLAVLQGAGLTDVCCVTTRYFGGTLLGSGGLVRAYSAAARAALREAGILVMGPGASGARLEGSKAFSKQFMKRHGVPTSARAATTGSSTAGRTARPGSAVRRSGTPPNRLPAPRRPGRARRWPATAASP